MMSQKLGLNAFEPATDETLVTELLAILQLVETDMTIFYRQLALIDAEVESSSNINGVTLMEPIMDAIISRHS